MREILLASLLATLAACAGAPDPVAQSGCPPPGWDRTRLAALKAAGFEIAGDGERKAFAEGITACLASPDPALRDALAYEALNHMLRAGQLTHETRRALLVDLSARLEGPQGLGFAQPFAALALSELVRSDRVDPFLQEDELAGLLVRAQHWFINISDYRGFSDAEGWRHGVAHGADLLMQLALNPRIDGEGLRLIVAGVGVQVAPVGISYIDGESERLARPVLVAAARGAMSVDAWARWLVALASPPQGLDVFGSRAGLAWRHDTAAFLNALYVNAVLGSDKADDVIVPGLEAALKALP